MFYRSLFWVQLCLHKWHSNNSSLNESQQCVSLNWGVHERKKKFNCHLCNQKTWESIAQNFWEKLWSQISHLNDLLESWTELSNCPFEKNFGHKCHIWTVSFWNMFFRSLLLGTVKKQIYCFQSVNGFIKPKMVF